MPRWSWLRVFVTLATLVVVWLVASPAKAFVGAGLCASSGACALGSAGSAEDPTDGAGANCSSPSTAEAESSSATSGSAPLCDRHGASAVAPPSQLQDVETSLDVDADATGPGSAVNVLRGLSTRDGSSGGVTFTHEPALAVVTHGVAPRAFVRVAAPRVRVVGSRAGVRALPERPPRA